GCWRMSRSTAWSAWCRSRATPSTSCSAPTSATCGCSSAGWTSSRACNFQEIATTKNKPPDHGPGADRVNAKSYAASALVSAAARPGGRRRTGKASLSTSAWTTRQREGFALIERADAALVETGFLDLQIGAVQRVRRQFLDREANRLGRGAKAPICKACPLLLADGGRKQFGGGIVTEGTHGL